MLNSLKGEPIIIYIGQSRNGKIENGETIIII